VVAAAAAALAATSTAIRVLPGFYDTPHTRLFEGQGEGMSKRAVVTRIPALLAHVQSSTDHPWGPQLLPHTVAQCWPRLPSCFKQPASWARSPTNRSRG
jgi:hypothetical protein